MKVTLHEGVVPSPRIITDLKLLQLVFNEVSARLPKPITCILTPAGIERFFMP